jgi:hypothetical protein
MKEMKRILSILSCTLCFVAFVWQQDMGAETTGGILLIDGKPILIRKILPTDCRVVRGFTHAPVDGRVDSQYSTGGLAEWSGSVGTPAVNYRLFNGNNGLHISLSEDSFDALLVRGTWHGRLYSDVEGLRRPSREVKPLCKIAPVNGTFVRRFEQTIQAKRLSFFYDRDQSGTLRDVTFLRIENGTYETLTGRVKASRVDSL